MEGCRIESYTQRKVEIFVDADACPVKKEILQLAHTYDVHTIFVASYSHVQKRLAGENGFMLTQVGSQSTCTFLTM